MTELSQGDTVRVVKLTFGCSVEGRRPNIGETATICHALEDLGYVAERIASNGTREWLCEFAPGDLERVEG